MTEGQDFESFEDIIETLRANEERIEKLRAEYAERSRKRLAKAKDRAAATGEPLHELAVVLVEGAIESYEATAQVDDRVSELLNAFVVVTRAVHERLTALEAKLN